MSRTRVYKALDNPWSLFGIQGDYILYTLVGMVASIFIGILLAAAVSSVVGIVAAIVGAVVVYLYIMKLQGMRTDKEQKKWMAARRYPHYVHIKPTGPRELMQVWHSKPFSSSLNEKSLPGSTAGSAPRARTR